MLRATADYDSQMGIRLWPRAPDSFWFRRHDEFDEPAPSADAGDAQEASTSK